MGNALRRTGPTANRSANSRSTAETERLRFTPGCAGTLTGSTPDELLGSLTPVVTEFYHHCTLLQSAFAWRLRRTEGALGENSSDSIGQRIEPEGRNAKEALRDNHQPFAQDAQLHLLRSDERRVGQ